MSGPYSYFFTMIVRKLRGVPFQIHVTTAWLMRAKYAESTRTAPQVSPLQNRTLQSRNKREINGNT
jgi:hypothetical protein